VNAKTLRGLLSGVPDDWEVIVAKDAEGNGFSPLSGIGEGHYKPVTTWFGEFLSHPDDHPPPFNAVALWPVN
jgi:hypothetical protein